MHRTSTTAYEIGEQLLGLHGALNRPTDTWSATRFGVAREGQTDKQTGKTSNAAFDDSRTVVTMEHRIVGDTRHFFIIEFLSRRRCKQPLFVSYSILYPCAKF